MIFKKFGILFSFLLILFLITSVYASGVDNNDLTIDSNYYQNSSFELNGDEGLLYVDDDVCIDKIGNNQNNDILKSGNVITVDSDDAHGDNVHNEMSYSTIQKAINDASEGDTIIINGEFYEHCHFVVNKKLTIISNVKTTMSTCPSNTQGSGYRGIFYIGPQASGTIIDGFILSNRWGDENDYGILVKGASDVEIRNCIVKNDAENDAIRIENTKNTFINNVNISSLANAIRIKGCQNIHLTKSIISNSNFGVNIIDSTKTTISNNNINSNKVSGIYIDKGNSYTNIISNNITYNKAMGVNLQSTEYVYILSNYIAHNRDGDEYNYNSGSGVYINCNITKVEIKGNLFEKNGNYAVLNDYRVRNILFKSGYDSFEIIDDNYMIGHGHRAVYHIKYTLSAGGDYSYDESSDIFTYVGSGNGQYIAGQDVVYLGYAYLIDEQLCPSTYFKYDRAGSYLWTYGNYRLQLSNITQIKKGIYSISIIKPSGEVAQELSSIYVTFYLNKNGTSVQPQKNDTYQTVLMKNGTAQVKFTQNYFNEKNNTLLASLPGSLNNVYFNPYMQLNIDDSDIPGILINSSITLSDLQTYPNSNEYVIATLKNQNGKAIAGETLVVTFNSRTTYVQTDSNGQAKIIISEPNEGSYVLTVYYDGDEIELSKCNATSQIIVKKDITTIISSNVYFIPNNSEYYYVNLKDEGNNPITNQKVTLKVNGKTYSAFSNSNGLIGFKLKFNKQKTYKVVINYIGSDKYAASSKTASIKVKYSSKKAVLSTPNISILPKKSKKYTISLKDNAEKAISKQKITIKLNGKKYIKKTNSKGQVKINIKFSKFKTYKIYAFYKGNKIYKKASSTGKIKVEKTKTCFSAPNFSMFPNEEKSYLITLKTKTGKSLSKQKITIKINGKSYSKITNSKGQASVNVKFSEEKVYRAVLTYKGNKNYKSCTHTADIYVERLNAQLNTYDRTYSSDLNQNYAVTLKDTMGNPLNNEKISFNYNGVSFTQTTDNNGKATINLGLNNPNVYDIVVKYDGNNRYRSCENINKIVISDKNNTCFIDDNLPNYEIQSIINNCNDGVNLEFLGNSYDNVALTIDKNINIYSQNKTTLNAMMNNPVFSIKSSNINISNLVIMADSNDAIIISDSEKVHVDDVVISNRLNESKLNQYLESTLSLPYAGIHISNSTNIYIGNNEITLFESGIFAEKSDNLSFISNILLKNNYGIKYGFDVSNSIVENNFISQSIGLYTTEVPEGPRGYGIFLNNSGVNISITKNNITWNHIGISVDANNTTGIVIVSNLISDNVLEGIRFNAGYDLAENATEIVVTDNAIYRNARGPSMMILGELSANPEGIYGPGQWDNDLKLKLDANWYGTNNLQTWDNETNITGIGTMCPRISTTTIYFEDIVCISPGNYSVTFYKNNTQAFNLAEFDLFATLNRATQNETEVNFRIVNGVGTFKFNPDLFNNSSNIIEISVGSLKDDTRMYKVFYSYNVPENEINS